MPTSRLVRDETPVEFFREQLEKALEHQRVATSTFTEFYLVNLLAGCVSGDPLPPPEPGYDEMPLAVLLARALQSSRRERTRMLRALGDSALFTSGFFADSLHAVFNGLGWQVDFVTVRVLLPVGISFYTFVTMSYVIDVYRREIPPTRDGFIWRGARVAESGGLENRCTFTGTVGSNPTLSARKRSAEC